VKHLFSRLAVPVLGGWLLAPACAAPPPVEPVVRPVRYVAVEATADRRTQTFAGVAQARDQSSLGFRVAGTIAGVNVVIGDAVPAGAPIARLDPEDYELRVREAEAAVRQADALANNAASNLRRTRALYENGNASALDVGAAVAAADSTAAQVDAASQRLELAQLQARRTRLVAPTDGVIADVLVAASEHVTAGRPVVVLTSGSHSEVEFAVPEGLIPQIRRSTPVSVLFGALPGARFAGNVTEVGVAALATGTMFPVIASVDTGTSVRPGMAAEVALQFGTGDAAGRIVVPPQAVGEDRDGRFVFVAEPVAEGATEPAHEPAGGELAVARRRAVTVGRFAGGGLEIVEGLSAGTRVVSAGVSRIADGDLVRLDAAWTTSG